MRCRSGYTATEPTAAIYTTTVCRITIRNAGTTGNRKPAQKKSKIWIIPVAAVATVLIAVLSVFLVKLNSGGAFTIDGAIDEFFDAYSTCDTDDYIDTTLSKDMLKATAKEYGMDTTEFIDRMDSKLESIKDTYGKMKLNIQDGTNRVVNG